MHAEPRPRRLLTLVCVVLSATMLSGCAMLGDAVDEVSRTFAGEPRTNGVDELPARKVVDRAREAAKSAPSVRVAGELVSAEGPLRVDMRFQGSEGATGRLTQGGESIEVLRVGRDLYLKGNKGFYRSVRAGDAAELLEGKYLRVPAQGGEFAGLAALTRVDTLIDAALPDTGKFSMAESEWVRDTYAIGVRVREADEGGVLFVSLEGKPYPLQIASLDGSEAAGSIDFLDYGRQVSLEKPAKGEVVDLDQLLERAS
ncbi:MAG: hypothetical protein ACRDPK_01525 [Carbonactinosporaceae bacterium]